MPPKTSTIPITTAAKDTSLKLRSSCTVTPHDLCGPTADPRQDFRSPKLKKQTITIDKLAEVHAEVLIVNFA